MYVKYILYINNMLNYIYFIKYKYDLGHKRVLTE